MASGGAAVAQPALGAARLERACLACYALITLGLAVWAGTLVSRACGGALGAPLDDSYIHFQFARSFANFRPFEYAPGAPRVAGATSLLWPALLTPALWLGASGSALVGLTWVLGFSSLFGQAHEVLLLARRFLDLPFAFAAGLLVLAFSANTWFAASAMEVVPLGFVLLRCARIAAEYIEGSRSRARARELLALAAIAVLLRPEGALGALMAGVAFTISGRRDWWRAGLSLATPLLVPLINLLFAGGATQTTTLAKWLPMNPYYAGHLGDAVLVNLQIFVGTLLDGREWSWTFIPEGYRLVGLLSLPALCLAAQRRGALAHAALLCVVGLGMLIPTTYETFLVNRLRYLWPFSGPWLLGLAALGQLVGQLVAVGLARVAPQLRPRFGLTGLLLPAACAVGFARLAPVSVADLAVSAAAITNQQVALGRWAAEALPKEARLGVNDAGAIAFYSGRRTFDVVGLTTQGEARYWVAGAGSRFEHYEKLSAAQLPTHFLVYPEWFGLSNLLGQCLTSRRVEGATILGGPEMLACEADLSSLRSGAEPINLGPREIFDEVDVADLESEAHHRYQLGPTSAQQNVLVTFAGRADGGRSERTNDIFQMHFERSGQLWVRLAGDLAATLTITIGDKPAYPSGSWTDETAQERSFSVPEGIRNGPQVVVVRSSSPVTILHYWSFRQP
jgi:hypothetical protein